MCKSLILRLLLPVLAASVLLSCEPGDTPSEEDKPMPETPVEPDPVPSAFESSFDAIRSMGVGWNLGNTLDAVWWTGGTDGRDWEEWETGWGQPVTSPELMVMMKNAGFGAIRVPVTWGVHMDADGKVFDEWMNRVNQIVDYVLAAGMYCIINVHHDTGADEGAWLVADSDVYAAVKDRYEGLWTQIAERFRSYDQRLLFEAYNEMLDESRSWCYASMNLGYDADAAAEAYDAINSYAQSFVDAVRATGGNNAARNLIVNTYGACNGSGTWNKHLQDPLKYMKMPSDNVKDHIIFQVHSYPMIDDIPAMEAEVSEMFRLWDEYLVSLGGPVIVGEWGTFSENPSFENYCYYADYFVRKAKEYGMGTFHWMSLSDGFHRSLPAFSHPELTEAIVKAYHGEDFTPEIPVIEDMSLKYKVTYNKLWSEVNLSSSALYLSDCKGIAFELEEAPEPGSLKVKAYGDAEGKEQYEGFSGTSGRVFFDRSVLGSKVSRVTLQCMIDEKVETVIRRVAIIKTDGTEEECMPSVFWGCEIELIVGE